MAHGFPIRLAPHDHGNQRLGVHRKLYCPCASVNPDFPSKFCRLTVWTISSPAPTMRCNTPSTWGCVTELPVPEVNRQRKLSVQNVSDMPSGQTLTPRLSIMVSVMPSPFPHLARSLSGSGKRLGQKS